MALSFADTTSPCILLVKTSSMGDVLHNLPVITDICRYFPAARIDWVAEESFALLPSLHPGIRRVIPVAIRRWRMSWWGARGEMRAACRDLHATCYDLVLDTQGLLKSALITRCAAAPRYGYDWNSAREPLSSLFYDHTFLVAKNLHAVERNRQLAAQALGYPLDSPADYGIKAPPHVLPWLPSEPFVVLLHATSREDKLWAEQNWIVLGRQLLQSGLRAVLPWGSEQERARSERLCASVPGAVCAPRLNLSEAAAMLGRARAVVGVDTGLSHFSAALGMPTVGIYTATNPGLTGLYAGKSVVNLGGAGASPTVDAVIAALNQVGIYD